MQAVQLQTILGTDEKNPYFTVCRSSKNGEVFYVYFGLSLLEQIDKGLDSFQYKYLLGRLYNARIKRKALIEAFGHPLTTLIRWGEAIKSGDVAIMSKVFSGNGRAKVLTEEVKKFVRSEFCRIYPENKYSYSKKIRERIKDVFGRDISSERLRHIFNDEKHKMCKCQSNCGKRGKDSNLEEEKTKEKVTDNARQEKRTGEDELREVNVASSCDSMVELNLKNSNIRKYALPNMNSELEMPEIIRINHLGLVIVLQIINNLKYEHKIIKQWLCSVLLGAVNLEQTEELDFKALEFMLDQPVLSSVYTQRVVLDRLVSEESRIEILQENSKLVGLKDHNIFYYDPHGVNYTGMRDILKGWCGSVGKITKVNYQDFIHTLGGDPVYFEIHDNYLDMRERFSGAIDVFTEKFLDKKKPTFIVDRGIYGKARVEEIDQRGYGLVTWEKGYKRDLWKEDEEQTAFSIIRCRNNAEDTKQWQVRFIRDKSWSRIENYHRLIVRILGPTERKKRQPEEAEVAVLSNGKIADQAAVRAILTRWIQENDFSYLIRNFGLNEITSYSSDDYDQIKGRLQEKEVFSELYDMLNRGVSSLRSELKKLLLEKQIAEHENRSFKKEKHQRIAQLTQDLQNIETEKKKASQKVSKIDKLIRSGKQCLTTSKKSYFDAIRITARNIFYLPARQFRTIFNNYRKDHQILRELIKCPGVIQYFKSCLIIELDPPRNYQPQQRKLVGRFLSAISDSINGNNKDNLPVTIRLLNQNKNGYPKKK